MIGIFGGTFDPIHYGHLRTTQEVQHALDLEQVRVIPAANPPHRQPPIATAEQRFAMAELACAEFPGFHVDDRELKRGGPSYTVLSLESLRAVFGERPLCLLMGMDTFEGLETWHRWQRLPQLAHCVVMTRPGRAFPDEASLPAWARACVEHDPRKLAQASAGKIYFQAVTPQDISATGIRAAIARTESVTGCLPPAVWEYIRANRVYVNRGN